METERVDESRCYSTVSRNRTGTWLPLWGACLGGTIRGACIWCRCALRALTERSEPQCVAHFGGVLHVARCARLGLAANAFSLGVWCCASVRATVAVVERRQAIVVCREVERGRGTLAPRCDRRPPLRPVLKHGPRSLAYTRVIG